MPNTYGLLHIASFSGELKIIKYLIEELGMNPNPTGVETTPLRFACKYMHSDCIEYLFLKGAYLLDENYIHNLSYYRMQEQKDDKNYEVIKYKTLNGQDVPPNLIFRVSDIRDEKIRYLLRWLRYKSLTFVCMMADKQENKENKSLDIYRNRYIRKAIKEFL
jgi:ankyrin repeat protein